MPFTFQVQVCFVKKLSLSLYYFLVHLLPQVAAHTLSGQAVMQSSSEPGHPPVPPRVYIIEGFLPPFLPLLPLPGATSTDSESPHCTEDPERRSPVKSLHGCALHLHKKYKLRNYNNISVHNGCKARGREVTGSRGSPHILLV